MTAVCLTFDHLGSAQRVGQGLLRRPDPDDPGATVGFPHILRLLAELDVRSTFFVEGWSLLHYPEQIEALLSAGHEVALHGWVHERWTELDGGEQERILSDGRAALHAAGIERAGFRAPHGCLTPATPALLADLGYDFDSSLLDPADEPPRAVRPLAGDVLNVPFSWPMVDAWQYRIRPEPIGPDRLVEEWLQLAQGPAEDVVTLVAHPHLSGVDPGAAAAFEQVARTLAADPDVRLCTVGEVAARARS